jgi:hypothetical protein
MALTHFLRKQHRVLEQLADAVAHERHFRMAILTELAEECAAHLAAEEAVLAARLKRTFGGRFPEDARPALAVAIGRVLSAAPDPDRLRVEIASFRAILAEHSALQESRTFAAIEHDVAPEELAALDKDLRTYYAALLRAYDEDLLPRKTG